MDVDRAICKLASEVAQVPFLENLVDVALQFIKTVQIFQHNNDRLLFMASKIVEDLNSMADYMLGRWDTAPEGLKHHLDEFKDLLLEMLGKLKKRRNGSKFLSFINATERDVTITGLQKRLDNAYDSILVYIALETNMGIHKIRKMIVAHEAQAKLAGAPSLLSPIEKVPPRLHFTEHNMEIFSQSSIRLERTLRRNCVTFVGSAENIYLTLLLAQCAEDGTFLLIKTYDSDSSLKLQLFRRERLQFIKDRQHYYHKIIGSSSTHVLVPFIVFNIPFLCDNPSASKDMSPSKEQAEQLVRSKVTEISHCLAGSQVIS